MTEALLLFHRRLAEKNIKMQWQVRGVISIMFQCKIAKQINMSCFVTIPRKVCGLKKQKTESFDF